MDRAVDSAPLPTRTERLSNLADCAVTAVFLLSGIDLRAVAWGGMWLREIYRPMTTHTHA